MAGPTGSDEGGFFIGVDLGGTKMRAAAVDAAGRIMAVAQGPTDPQDAGRGVDALVGLIRTVGDEARPRAGEQVGPRAVGVGAPGPLDAATGRLLNPPNLPGWHGTNLVGELSRRLELPVVLENDANVAALGEHRCGSAAGLSDFLYITLGTGIGGAVFTDGRLHRGVAGGAGEIGHVQVADDGPLCGCGRRGCLESLASGPAIARAAGATRAEDVFVAAGAGDAKAREVLAAAGRALGRGLAAACSLLDPEAVIAGGGILAADPAGLGVYLGVAERTLAGSAFLPPGRSVPILKAALGPEAGVLGAASLAAEAATGPAGVAGPAVASRPPKVVEKPWGREIWWAQTDRYVGKIIEVRAGTSLSLQYHRRKLETMLFVDGQGAIQLGDEVLTVGPGRAVTIAPGMVHRVSALTDLRFYEVSTPEVEDVVRIKDDFGRAV